MLMSHTGSYICCCLVCSLCHYKFDMDADAQFGELARE